MTPDRCQALFEEAARLAHSLTDGSVGNKRALMLSLVCRITLSPDQLGIVLDRRWLIARLEVSEAPSSSAGRDIEIATALRLKRRGVEAKLVIEPNGEQQSRIDEHLVGLVARALRWFEEIRAGEAGSIQEIAGRENRDPSDIGRELQFAFLAPDIVDAILAGRQPVELTARRLRHMGSLPMDWQAQRELLGFAA